MHIWIALTQPLFGIRLGFTCSVYLWEWISLNL